LTGNIIELDEQYYSKLSAIIKSEASIEKMFKDEDLEFLTRRGFIVKSEVNELDILKIWWKKGFSQNVLTLTLEPTLRCNFACTYCFEDTTNGTTMGDKEIQKLLRFIKKYMTE